LDFFDIRGSGSCAFVFHVTLSSGTNLFREDRQSFTESDPPGRAASDEFRFQPFDFVNPAPGG
jgi:hypothetical protein